MFVLYNDFNRIRLLDQIVYLIHKYYNTHTQNYNTRTVSNFDCYRTTKRSCVRHKDLLNQLGMRTVHIYHTQLYSTKFDFFGPNSRRPPVSMGYRFTYIGIFAACFGQFAVHSPFWEYARDSRLDGRCRFRKKKKNDLWQNEKIGFTKRKKTEIVVRI